MRTHLQIGLQHLGLDQNAAVAAAAAAQGWGGLSRSALGSHCLPPPPSHHSATQQQQQQQPIPAVAVTTTIAASTPQGATATVATVAATTSAFNPFHHGGSNNSSSGTIEQRSSRLTANGRGIHRFLLYISRLITPIFSLLTCVLSSYMYQLNNCSSFVFLNLIQFFFFNNF